MGRDKALLEIEGQPLWRRQLAILRRLSPLRLMISSPPREGCECEVVPDAVENAGPLAGVAPALERCDAPLLVVLAIDLPNVTTAFLRSLLAQCSEDQGVVPRSAERCEPLAAIYPVRCAGLATAALERRDFSMQNFVRESVDRGYLSERVILPEETHFFTNINTPADYERARCGAIHQHC